MTKQQAIKEIEKLTNTTRITLWSSVGDGFLLFPNDYTFVNSYDFDANDNAFYGEGSGFVIKDNSIMRMNESEYREFDHFSYFDELPIKQEWLEPLSILIPILFKEGE